MRKTNRKAQGHKNSNRENGVALIAAILTLLLISAITAGIIILTNTETNTSTNFKDEQRAFFAAKAGIEEVRDRLRTGTPPPAYSLRGTTPVVPTTLPGSGTTGVLYILNPLNGETVDPWNKDGKYPDDEICNETTTVSCTTSGSPKYPTSVSGWYSTVNANSTFAPASGSVLDWKWVRVTLKQNNSFGANYYVNGSNNNSYVCWNNGKPYEVLSYPTPTAPCVSPDYLPVYVLTALAVTPSGSRRMVQVEAAEDTLQFTAPSALTLDGSGDLFDPGTSAKFGVNGNDHVGCGVTTTGTGVPAVGVPSNTDKTNVINQIATAVNNNTGKENNYTGSGSTTPDVQNIYSALPKTMQSVTSLNDLMSVIKSDVTQPVINGAANNGSIANPGSAAAPQIIYVNGDLTLTGNFTGYGILVVTGTFTAKGTTTWNGLVFVVGQGIYIDKGTNTYNGAMVIANTTASALGVAKADVSGGGNGGVNYSSGCIAQATTLTTFHVISMRELMN